MLWSLTAPVSLEIWEEMEKSHFLSQTQQQNCMFVVKLVQNVFGGINKSHGFREF